MTNERLFEYMFGTAVVSLLYPWHPSWPAAKVVIHLPWLLIPLWIYYEAIMPAEINIHIDLLFIIPAVLLVFAMYAMRLVIFLWIWKKGRFDFSDPDPR